MAVDTTSLNQRCRRHFAVSTPGYLRTNGTSAQPFLVHSILTFQLTMPMVCHNAAAERSQAPSTQACISLSQCSNRKLERFTDSSR